MKISDMQFQIMKAIQNDVNNAIIQVQANDKFNQIKKIRDTF